MKENFAPRVKGMTFIALTESRFPLLVLNNIPWGLCHDTKTEHAVF